MKINIQKDNKGVHASLLYKIAKCIFPLALCFCVVLSMIAPASAVSFDLLYLDGYADTPRTETLEDGSTVKYYNLPTNASSEISSYRYDDSGEAYLSSEWFCGGEWYGDRDSSDDDYITVEMHPFMVYEGDKYALYISPVNDLQPFQVVWDFKVSDLDTLSTDVILTAEYRCYDSNDELLVKKIAPETVVLDSGVTNGTADFSFTFDIPANARILSVIIKTNECQYVNFVVDSLEMRAIIPAAETETPIPDDSGTTGDSTDTETGGVLASIGSGVAAALSAAGRVVTALFTSEGALVLLLPVIGLAIALALVIYLIKRKSVRV